MAYMHADHIRKELHQILNNHDATLEAIRQANKEAHTAMRRVFKAHDAALVSAIDANRAALRLLNRLLEE